jgi:hypothetical protein
LKRLSIWSGGFLLLISLFLAGCGEFEFGVETRFNSGGPETTVVVTATQQIADNTILVTMTPSAGAVTETPTVTPLATETTTATPSATPTETATPTPTVTVRATSRPFVPTATPVPPQIYSFTAVPQTVSPGSSVTVNWSAEGESALLCVVFVGGYTDNCYEVAVSGSYTVLVEDDFRSSMFLELAVSNATGQQTTTSIYIELDCPDEWWFFDNPPDNCPARDAADSLAAAQYFEGGWMLWVEESNTIYAFYEPQRSYSPFYDGFADPDDPAADNDDYNPPDGFFVPKRGFGLVWHDYSYVRDMLGWALAPEFGFETTYQADTDPYNQHIYVVDPDGRIVVLNTYSLTWGYR